MVEIQEQPHKTHGNHWRAMFSKEEKLDLRCPITHEEFSEFERVLICNKCSVVFKKQPELHKQQYPCGCDKRFDVEYFNCEVIVRK